jgi:hypothetical protein
MMNNKTFLLAWNSLEDANSGINLVPVFSSAVFYLQAQPGRHCTLRFPRKAVTCQWWSVQKSGSS